MPRLILMGELHVQLVVVPTLPAAVRTAVRRHPTRPGFRRSVVRAVRSALTRDPARAAVRVRLAR